MSLPKISRSGVSSEVVHKLLENISSGKFKPGDKLPSERELGISLGVGRGSVREALRILEAMGLIKIYSGKGAYVAEYTQGGTDFYAFWNSVHPISIENLVEVRFAIEPIAAGIAAGKISDEALTLLDETLQVLKWATDLGSLEMRVEADVQFHMGIIRVSENPIFLQIYQGIDPLLRESRRISLLLPERVAKVSTYHQGIYQAISNRQPREAYLAMWNHLDDFRRDMKIQSNSTELGLIPLSLTQLVP